MPYLDVRRQKESSSWRRAYIDLRMKRLELLYWTATWFVRNQMAELAKNVALNQLGSHSFRLPPTLIMFSWLLEACRCWNTAEAA